MKTLYIALLIIGVSTFQNTITAQDIDPDTGQIMKSKTNLDSIPTKAEKKREKILDKLVKTNSRHKPFRIRTGFGHKFADIDLSPIIEKSYTLAIDIPTFTFYKELYLGISGFANVNTLNTEVQEALNLDVIIIYGANASLNYSLKIIDGLYIVPLVGYGYIGVRDLGLDQETPEIDPTNPTSPTVDDVFSLNTKDSSKTYVNYGVFLDFSFLLSANGIGLTAGYTNYSGFTFGIQF